MLPFSLDIFISGILLKGNSDNITLKGGLNAAKETHPLDFGLYMETTYGESKGVKNANSGKVVLNLDYYILKRVETFLFLSAEYDEMAGLDNRSDAGLGFKYDFLKDSIKEFSTSLAVLRSYERYFDENPRWIYRLSLRPKFRFKYGGIRVFAMVFYKPNIENFHDYLIDARANILISITKHLSLRISVKNDYNSLAPEGLSKNDIKTFLGLNISL